MKKIFLTLFVVAIVTFAFQKSTKETFKSYFPSGKLKAITEMENGRKNGREELFFENGNLFMVQYFKDDMPVDSFYQYNKDKPGEILFKGYSTFRSRTTTLFANGQVFAENDFKENLVADGLMTISFDNGNTASTSVYKNGKRNGPNIQYFQNGNIKAMRHYKEGVEVPPTIEYDSTGKMIGQVLVGK